MNRFAILSAAAALFLASAPAMAQGDAEAGEKVARKCMACHTFEQGGANKVGPNLWNVWEAGIAHKDDFRYSDSYVTLREQGFEWTDETMTAYLKDSTKFVREQTGDTKARSKMTFKLRKEDEIQDVIAYIKTLK